MFHKIHNFTFSSEIFFIPLLYSPNKIADKLGVCIEIFISNIEKEFSYFFHTREFLLYDSTVSNIKAIIKALFE
jgi:hypothetical protein